MTQMITQLDINDTESNLSYNKYKYILYKVY